MTAPRYIRHLTIDTGDQRDSYPTEAPPEVRQMLRPLIDRAVAGERVPVPGALDPPGCTITGLRGRRGRGLSLAIWGPPVPGTDGMPVPLVSLGIAPVSLASAEVWQAITGRERDDMTPSAPYCAVRLHPTAVLHLPAMAWLGDLQRCLAWAWVD